MISSKGSPSLRPLGIGEMLDRAVTIAVRARVPLAVYVGIAVFVATFETAVGIDYLHLVRLFRNVPGAWQSGTMRIAGTTILTGYNGWLAYASSIPNDVVGSFTFGALIVYATHAVLGDPASLRAAYGTSGRRLARLVCVQALSALPCTAFAFVGIDLIAVGVALVVRDFDGGRTPAPLAVAVLALLLLVVVPAVLVTFACTIVAWYVAQCECVVGGRSIVASMRAAVRSAFPRRAEDLRRAFAVGATIGATFSAAIVVGLVAQRVVVASTHVGALGVLVLTTAMSLALGFVSVLATVHYVDLRVRREGIDLALAARSLNAPA